MSRAAVELGVTHGAVSHQVRALETTLAVKLFVRHGNTLALTPQGAAMLPAITQAFKSMADAIALVKSPSASGELVISCIPSLLVFWILPRLDRFSQRFPDVKLNLISSNRKRQLYFQDVDVWITHGHEGWPDTHCEFWLHTELLAVCSPALMNSRPLRKVSDLRNHTLLDAYDDSEWNDWIEAAGAPELAIAARRRMSDAHMATLAATYGQGIALCDSLTAADFLEDGRLVEPFDIRIPTPKPFFIVCKQGWKDEPIVRAFTEWIFDESAEARPLGAAAPA